MCVCVKHTVFENTFARLVTEYLKTEYYSDLRIVRIQLYLFCVWLTKNKRFFEMKSFQFKKRRFS